MGPIMLLGHTQMKEDCKLYLLQIIILTKGAIRSLDLAKGNHGYLQSSNNRFLKTYKQVKTHTPATRLVG